MSNVGNNGTTREYWRGGNLGFDVFGQSTTIPNGLYSFSVQALYRGHLDGDVPTGIIAYAESAGNQYMTPICNYTDGSKPGNDFSKIAAAFNANANDYLNTIPYIIVTDGKIKVGVKSMSTQPFCHNGMWFLYNTASFKVSVVTDISVLTTALSDVKKQANELLKSNADTSDERTALQNAIASEEVTSENIVNIKQKMDVYLAKLSSLATSENPKDVSCYFVNPKYSIRNLDLVGGLVTSGKAGALGQPFGWTCFDAGGSVDDGSGKKFQEGQGFNWFSTIGNSVAIDGHTANYDEGKTGGFSIYQRIAWNQWAEQTHSAKQTVTLPAGKYKISVPAYASANSADYKAYVKFTIGATEYENIVKAGSWNVYERVFLLSEEADVCVDMQFNKLRRDQSQPSQYAFFDGVTLTSYGEPLAALKYDFAAIKNNAVNLLSNEVYETVIGVERTSLSTQSMANAAAETIDAYQKAISDVQVAIDAFEASKRNYDALIAEIAKAKSLGIAAATADSYAANKETTAAIALAKTQELKVLEYNYVKETFAYQVELGTWTAEGPTGQLETQHWSGANSPYLEQSSAAWGTNSWTISYSQDLTLPKGNYVFKVAGRKEVSEQVVMTLSVKKGSETLGSVNDFPEGGTGKGLDTSGATNFGDGTYANSNNGFGWEWRYVKFTLDEEATVKVAVDAKATAEKMWVSFCDATVQTDNEANISLIKYNIALNDAKLAVAKEDYKNVNGGELVALNNAIGADATLDKTDKAAIETATNTLKTATEAFIVAKTAYDEYAAAVVQEYAELPYAAAAKYTALLNAQAPAIPASAEDAATKTNAIIQAYRVYLESNALAEGVDGAKVISVPDYRFAGLTRVDNSFGTWTIHDQTNGTIQLLSDQSFTDGEGKSDYTYIDIYKNDNNARVQQSLELEPGKYMMTVTARCKSGMGAQFQAFAGGVWVDIPQMGNAGGQFGRGWNDVSVEFVVTEKKSVDLGVKSNWGKDIWWGATRFRLVKLAGTESVNISISSAEYSTFIAPFEVKIPAGLAAYTVDGVKDNGTTLVMTEVETIIPANTPVVLNGAEGVSEVSGVNVATQDSYTEGLLTGVYADTNAPVGSYVLQNKSEGVAFYYVEEGKQPKVKANRAYLTVPAEANVRALFFGDDEATAIEGLGALTEGDIEGIYSANGVKVGALQKGVNIIKRVDGSSFKVMVK